AMRRGALEVLPKPEDTPSWQQLAESLPATVRAVAEARAQPLAERSRERSRPAPPPVAAPAPVPLRYVAVRASTGGPAALRELFLEIPAEVPVSFLVVQHIAAGFELGFADWLNKEFPHDVRLAKDGERPAPGAVRLAPGGSHLLLEPEGVLRL